MIPTPESVERLIATLEGHAKPKGKGVPSALANVRRRLLGAHTPPEARGAVWREWECGTPTSDGYSAQTLGDGMPRGSGSGLTATEAAASARMARPPRDDHRRLTHKACAALEATVAGLNALDAALVDLEALRGHEAVAEPCDSCGPLRDVLAPIHARGTVGGRLDDAKRLCQACYNYVARYGVLPVPTAVSYHEATGRWPSRRVQTTIDFRETRCEDGASGTPAPKGARLGDPS